MKTKTYIIIALLTFLSGCTKDDSPKLPPATQVGANTFGCKIDGVIYECSGYNDGGFGMINYGDIKCRISNESIYIKAELKNYSRPHISLNFKHDQKTGTYYNINGIVGNPNSYVKLTRYNMVSRIISGTFEFTQTISYDSKGNPIEKRHVTEGRFDIKFKE